ncbi:hypothetical protein GWK47_004457 [Chionoecetes opilio]|uniref:Uncharacterized protein n=1 Tax=Chionoecetes opilio TaxID=41210 RepID=A0A8J5CYR0_CHIOP|nr:hypothetical protein GWK47_004457 [Chionoecetes opilio]
MIVVDEVGVTEEAVAAEEARSGEGATREPNPRPQRGETTTGGREQGARAKERRPRQPMRGTSPQPQRRETLAGIGARGADEDVVDCRVTGEGESRCSVPYTPRLAHARRRLQALLAMPFPTSAITEPQRHRW